MKNTSKLLAGMLCVLLAGCGASSGTAETIYEYEGKEAAGGYNTAAGTTEIADSVPLEDTGTGSDMQTEISTEDDLTQKLVYSGSMEVQTLNYDDTLAMVRGKITEYGGFVEWESQYDNDYNWYYSGSTSGGTRHINLTIRIPSEKYDAFMSDMEGSGKVVSSSSYTENITRQYYDNEALIESLELQETRLLEMMEKAETIEDMIAVETRLTEVQAELNQYRTYRRTMDTDVSYSTVQMKIDEVKEYVNEPDDPFITQLGNQFVSGWKGLWHGLKDLVLAVTYAFPYLLILAGIIFAVVKSGFRIHLPEFGKKKNKEEKPEEHNEQ